jgi:hypothetical protein
MVTSEAVPPWTGAFAFQLIHVDAQLRQLGFDFGKFTGLVPSAGVNLWPIALPSLMRTRRAIKSVISLAMSCSCRFIGRLLHPD